MKSHTFVSAALAVLTAELTSASASASLNVDVAVVGGGSSGTYAAIRLQDLNYSVAVIEQKAVLGGHVETYITPSGVPVDYGVSNFQNISVVLDFFARFDIPLETYVQAGTTDVYANFATGETLPNGTIPTANFTGYLAALAKFPYLSYGYDLPDPVPADLLLPFGEFVEKYDLGDVAYTIALFAAGTGNVLDQTALYVLKAVDTAYIEGIVGSDITPASHDTHELFDKALAALGSNALLSSTVSSATRSASGIELVVQTPQGETTVRANKLLITAPPELYNLAAFDLDSAEYDVFSQFTNDALYVGLLNDTGLAAGYNYYNGDAASTYAIPAPPDTQMIWATDADGIFWAWYTSPTAASQAEVEANTIAAVRKLAGANVANPTFVAFGNHTPSTVHVTAEQIGAGFYRDLYALQGHRNTWYVGSAWVADHSSALWNYTESVLLPQLTA